MTAASPTNTVRHPCSRRCKRLVVVTVAAVGLAALAWAACVSPLPRLVYNPSGSVPIGWYRVDPLERRADLLSLSLPVGSIILVPLPAEAAILAARRGYLPLNVPLLKPVGAVAPQKVCVTAGIVRIDGVPVAAVLRADRLGRPLSFWRQCRRLHPGELFLLSTDNPASFDSRYFGPVQTSAVIGLAHPLWTWP